jgi:hypothetical protein
LASINEFRNLNNAATKMVCIEIDNIGVRLKALPEIELRRGVAFPLSADGKPLLPRPKRHPVECHRPGVPNRAAMDAILLLRTGMQWNALDGTGICSCSAAYRRFRERDGSDVFATFWRPGLLEYDELKGIYWDWLALDSAMAKAASGGEKTGPSPVDRAKGGVQLSMLPEAAGDLAREMLTM